MALDKVHKRHAIWIEIIVVVLILASAALGVAPSEQWNKTFGETGHDFAYSVQQIADGSYIFAGTANLNPQQGNPNAWLIKTDTNGNQQWKKTFGLTTYDAPPFVQKTSDGGFVLGTSVYDGANTFDIHIIKFDANGNQQWIKTFGKTDNDLSYGHDFAYALWQTSDGGYIIAGQTDSFGCCHARLFKTDVNGNLLWNKIGADIYYDKVYSIEQTLDGGYVFLANNNLLIKTDSFANEQWNRTFQGTLNSVHQTLDGGYIMAGNAGLIKIDTNGNQQWKKVFKGDLWSGTVDPVQQTLDGGYILAGRIALGSGGGGWFVKTESNGNEQWNKTFPGPYGAFIISARQTSDGGYILAGNSGSYATIIKLSRDESSTSVPTNTPTSTPTVTQILTPIPTITPTTTSTSTPTVTPSVTPSPTTTKITTTTAPTPTSQLEQEVKELKERLNKTEEKQSQQESRISWWESVINSIRDWFKSIL